MHLPNYASVQLGPFEAEVFHVPALGEASRRDLSRLCLAVRRATDHSGRKAVYGDNRKTPGLSTVNVNRRREGLTFRYGNLLSLTPKVYADPGDMIIVRLDNLRVDIVPAAQVSEYLVSYDAGH